MMHGRASELSVAGAGGNIPAGAPQEPGNLHRPNFHSVPDRATLSFRPAERDPNPSKSLFVIYLLCVSP